MINASSLKAISDQRNMLLPATLVERTVKLQFFPYNICCFNKVMDCKSHLRHLQHNKNVVYLHYVISFTHFLYYLRIFNLQFFFIFEVNRFSLKTD